MAKKNTAGNATAAATATPAGGTAGTGPGMVPDGPTAAVWDALQANPGASVAAIASAAGVAEHKTRRVLAELEIAERVVRTRGRRVGGKRLPDAWYPAATASAEPAAGAAPGTDATTPADQADTPPTTDAPTTDAPAAVDPDTTTAGEPEADTGDTGDAAPLTADAGPDAVALADARDALSGLGMAISTALEALDAGQGAVALSASEEIFGYSGKARRLVRTAVNGPARCASGRAKAQPGQLRAKVAAHLNAFPGKEFTPHEVAKVIGHSAGAISNALERLTELGTAACTCERPRRFTAVPDTGTGAGETAAE